MSSLSVIWFAHAPAQPGSQPELHEQPHHGDFHGALVRAIAQSREPDFLLGQVLAADGRVMATVAPAGAVKLAPAA
ncbi:hypothetical protein AB4Y45_35770 [Paraburkholderia sp. EG287A]|uniref:hypothetical protein n=1 Tax=Paraburkholderia sp. EG287A TaxID=3237012 RepID=UPI0034D15D85